MASAEQLAGLIAQNTEEDGMHATAIPRVFLIRSERPTQPIHALHEPAMCLVAQGRKHVLLGRERFDYDPAKFLIVSVDVPIVGHVVEASRERPYLCLRLDLDAAMLGALMVENGLDRRAAGNPGPGVMLSEVTPELLDAAVRLLGLLASPRDIPALAPLIEREILYRLLTGDQAHYLREVAFAESRLQQVNRAIGWIKRNYCEPLRIEALAAIAGMSSSSFHAHFKAVTAMSPLQYQKQLRLQEARRLILTQAMDAANASHQVGYESPSQFSREYKRLFGAPPARDVARLRALPEPMLGV